MATLLLLAPQDPQAPRTFVYKVVEGTKIEVDLHRREGQDALPAVIWIHGGALITGSRQQVPKNLLEFCRAEGIALVSIDYRLAPEVKLPAIIEDLRDALAWVRGEGARAARLDPKKEVVVGGSAGGYLTLMAGLAEPRPQALVAYWGYGDVDGDWYAKPSPFYREKTPLVPREEALRAVGGPVLTAPVSRENADARGRYYRYLRQNGLWTREVTGFDPETEKAKLDPYCPVRNVTPSYPPTFLLHGTEDTDVPHELSAAMARELARHKVAHEFVSVPGAGHGLAGGDRTRNAEAHARALDFIRKSLK